MIRPLTLVALGIFIFASAVRLANLGERSLTHDEAWRANWSHHGGMDEARRTPPLQYAMNWTIQHVVGRSEFVLRLPYALAGIVCVVVLFEVTRRTVHVHAAVFVAAVAAAHPALVGYSRALKVFSLEAMMSALLIWAGLETYQRFTRRNLFLFLVVAVVGIGLTFTTSLMITAWTPLLVWAALRGDIADQGPRASLRTLLGVLGVIALFGAGWYWWLAGCPYRAMVVQYHTQTFDSWPAAYAPVELAGWMVRSAFGATRYAIGMELVWTPLNWVIGTMTMLALSASVVTLWQRARPLVVFIALLFPVAFVAAALRQWPMAALPMSTYLVPPAVIAIGCGLATLVRPLGRSVPSAVILGVCLALPAARAVKATMVAPSMSEHVRPVFAYISAHKQPGDAVFIYYGVSDASEFYWHDAKTPALVQPGSDRGQLERFMQRFDGFIAEHGRVWFVFTHDWGSERANYMSFLTGHYRLLDAYENSDASGHLFTDQDQ